MRSLSVQMIMGRIAVAEENSKIAVYKNSDGTLDARFADCLRVREDIVMRHPSLVGVWCRHDNQNEVLAAMGFVKPAKRNRQYSKQFRGVVPA